MPMNPEIKAEWLERLRSGRYTQTRAALNRTVYHERPGNCCLGVLCDIAVDRGLATWEHEDDYRTLKGIRTPYKPMPQCEGHTYTDYIEESVMPHHLKAWAQLADIDEERLITINDRSNDYTAVIEYIQENC